ncbi:MAG: cytochrome c, partial [Acidobacteriota bacterium]|nr:cytochrome c [Acidobacteriota bacterium]
MTRLLWISIVVAALAAGHATAQAPLSASEEHFKYASVGIEQEEGLPYWIWQALPRLFPDLLPGGYGALGFVWEPGRELPVGFSKRDVLGTSRVAVNCAFCHTATYRRSPDEGRRIVSGGAATRIDPQRFSRFLESAAADARFDAAAMLAVIDQMGTLSWIDRLTYRFVLIPGTRRALLRHREEFSWMDSRPVWGPGRIDPLNPFKFRQLRQPLDDTVGNADITPLWALGLRDGRAFHWDGINPSLREVLIGSAIGNGASVTSVDLESVETVGRWLAGLRPPPYPYPTDPVLVERGHLTYADACASCHDAGGARLGEVIPIGEIGTDRHRLDTWTAASAAAFNGLAAGQSWQPRGYRKTAGYVAMPLAGVWLNAPYLHNGSVPTLVDLLEPAERRPRRFVRGYDVYDPRRVGFVAEGAAA